jgi:cytochrome c
MTTSARVFAVSTAVAAVILAVTLGWEDKKDAQRVLDNARSITSGGDPSAGRELLAQYGCGSCHDIPGVAAARGAVGPPLGSMSERAYVGGVLPHTPENLMRWIENPQGIDSLTAMPTLGVTRKESRHMAAYLYTLGK